ncbi:Dynamin [Cynara cardunculus var. scolymus]|uniref:Dynamin n=1 Tax=Cynara cardunculus var. scolymus TaxID=59895 RepID=A0A103YKZ8_CYNCS|nr:Dynamin [Cynara cardunculus var. scolymus]
MAMPKQVEHGGEWESHSRLYEAYNELHGLAQEFETPFDAPAVLVVGHQTDGKSALVEALMGFQFNHVGGGTKTRRPITLHMKFNPECDSPLCHLISDSDSCVPEEKSLQEVQEYIEAENMRLERETYQFSSKEIIVRVEYKYCPNLTIIDTPGLIAPAPGRKNRALQAQSRAVESLVRAKMQHKEFIVLCLEDCNDWSNATTRRVVMQAISLREMEDVTSLEEKLGRSLSNQERSRIGVSSLKLFLEELLQKRYMDSVPLIIPLLEKEHRSTTRMLNDINQELRVFHDLFVTKLSLLLKGTVVAPPDKFGETLQDERVNGGALIGIDGSQFPLKLIPNAGMRLYGGAQYHRAMAEFRFVVGGIKCPPITREEIVNACGVEDIHDGTNYSRSLPFIFYLHKPFMSSISLQFQYFCNSFLPSFETLGLHVSLLLRKLVLVPVLSSLDLYVLPSFSLWVQLGSRLLHILKRLLPISVYLLQKEGEFLSGHEVFLRRVSSAFNNFAESTERSCHEKCMEDLLSTTRYVTWSLHNKNRAGLRQFLDSFGGAEQPVNGGTDSSTSVQTTETRLADLLDSTLWNRRLAPSSERIVYALVQQIFHGIREYFLASAELKFNCFFLMPVVDKLPALLREDLESAFEDDLDNVFDITNLRHSLGQQKRETEIEMKRIQRLKDKFRKIHEQLSLHQVMPGP